MIDPAPPSANADRIRLLAWLGPAAIVGALVLVGGRVLPQTGVRLGWFVPVESTITVGVCLVMVIVGILESRSRPTGDSAPMVTVAMLVAVLAVARTLTFPGVVPGVVADRGITSWLFEAEMLLLPVGLLWTVCDRRGRPWRAAATPVRALGIGLVAGIVLVAVVSVFGGRLPALMTGGGSATALRGPALLLGSLPSGALLLVGLRSRPARVTAIRSAAAAAAIPLVVAGLTGLSPASYLDAFDPEWYAVHLLFVGSMSLLLAGQFALFWRSLEGEARLVQESALRIHQLVTLQRAAQLLSAALDRPSLRRIIVRAAVSVVSPAGHGLARAVLFRVEGETVTITGEYDESGLGDVGRSFPLRSSPMIALAVATGEVVTGDLDLDRFGDDVAGRLRDLGLSSGAWAPVTVNGRVHGVLAVVTRGEYRFNPEQLDSLHAIARLAGLALTEVMHLDRERRMTERLRRLADVNLALSRQTGDLGAVLRGAAEAARALTGAERGVVELPTLDRVATPPTAEAPARAGSVLSVPVMLADGTSGTLRVETPAPGAADFSTDDVALLDILAAHLGVTVDNARSLRRIADSARIDPLTGVHNRRAFDLVLSETVRDRLSVMVLDIDHLKVINDEAGHEAGDAVLRAVGRAITETVRSGDVVSRTGGDEFAVVMPGAGSDAAAVVARRIQTVLEGLHVPHGQARVSIGIATGVEGDEVVAVWKHADVALLRAKRAGRNRLRVWDGEGTPAHECSAALLDRVLGGADMTSVYQPIVGLVPGRPRLAFEALARPDGLGPSASVEGLFATAQRDGRMRDLDWRCRRAAIEHARCLGSGMALFLNISAGALLDPVHDVDQMLLLLAWGGRSPDDVVLEITERELVDDLDRLAVVAARYRRAGFRFAVDDVGEGRSTFPMMLTVRPEFIKIAGPIARRSDQPENAAFIAAMVTFAGLTGAQVIAEGLETEEQAARAAALGVSMGQGYLFSPPLPVAALAAAGRLHSGSAWPPAGASPTGTAVAAWR
jgi:diguanylate cyclase (GGDEF)-like protein